MIQKSEFCIQLCQSLPSLIYFLINKPLKLHFSSITQSSKQEKQTQKQSNLKKMKLLSSVFTMQLASASVLTSCRTTYKFQKKIVMLLNDAILANPFYLAGLQLNYIFSYLPSKQHALSELCFRKGNISCKSCETLSWSFNFFTSLKQVYNV